MSKEKKSRDYYTIENDLYKKFIKHIETKNLNKSKLIETLIRDYMEVINK